MPTMTWQTFGHQPAKNILEKQLAAGKFPHAYLFSGPQGVGKKTLALEFAKKVLKTENLESHPDFSVLDEEGEITVEATLQFMSRLHVKPFFGPWKVAVVNNAHNLNVQSANALLKTLEEPSESTILILVSARGTVMPTIASRCQIFYFRGLNIEQLEDYCSAKKIKLPESALRLCFGSVHSLTQMASGKEFLARAEQNISAFSDLKGSPIGVRLSKLNKYAEMEAQDLAQLFETWALWQSAELASNPAGYKAVHYLCEAIQQSRTNKNKKLILQDLFLKI